MITSLEYRLAWKQLMPNGRDSFHAFGDRYPTREAARRDAPTVNRERLRHNIKPADSILYLPMKGQSDCDPSHFVNVEPL